MLSRRTFLPKQVTEKSDFSASAASLASRIASAFTSRTFAMPHADAFSRALSAQNVTGAVASLASHRETSHMVKCTTHRFADEPEVPAFRKNTIIFQSGFVYAY